MIAQQNTELTTTEIEAYLLQHPEFFHEHLPLLENMKIPHPSGDAVSLISKQLELFRKRHHDLENQLTALLAESGLRVLSRNWLPGRAMEYVLIDTIPEAQRIGTGTYG